MKQRILGSMNELGSLSWEQPRGEPQKWQVKKSLREEYSYLGCRQIRGGTFTPEEGGNSMFQQVQWRHFHRNNTPNNIPFSYRRLFNNFFMLMLCNCRLIGIPVLFIFRQLICFINIYCITRRRKLIRTLQK